MGQLTAGFQGANASRSLTLSMSPTIARVDVVQDTKCPRRKVIQELERTEIKLPQTLDQLKTFFCQTNTPSIQDSYEIVDANEVDNDEAGNTQACQAEWSSQEPSREYISFQLSWWGYRIYFPSRALKSLGEKRPKECANFVAVQLGWYLQAIPPGILPLQIRLSLLALGKFVIPKIEEHLSRAWDKVVVFDRGEGIMLTASWLCPFIYVPSAWSPHQSKPLPAPRFNPRLKAKVRTMSVDDMVILG